MRSIRRHAAGRRRERPPRCCAGSRCRVPGVGRLRVHEGKVTPRWAAWVTLARSITHRRRNLAREANRGLMPRSANRGNTGWQCRQYCPVARRTEAPVISNRAVVFVISELWTCVDVRSCGGRTVVVHRRRRAAAQTEEAQQAEQTDPTPVVVPARLLIVRAAGGAGLTTSV